MDEENRSDYWATRRRRLQVIPTTIDAKQIDKELGSGKIEIESAVVFPELFLANRLKKKTSVLVSKLGLANF